MMRHELVAKKCTATMTSPPFIGNVRILSVSTPEIRTSSFMPGIRHCRIKIKGVRGCNVRMNCFPGRTGFEHRSVTTNLSIYRIPTRRLKRGNDLLRSVPCLAGFELKGAVHSDIRVE